MPIYAYRCEGCGFQKDALQKLSDPPLVDCPQCGQPKMVKQVTAAGFALKGSGWYVTDFRDQKKPATKTTDNNGTATAPADGTASASAVKETTSVPAAPASTATTPVSASSAPVTPSASVS